MWWSPIHPAFAPLIGALLISLFLYARYIKSTYGLAIIGVISILNAIRALAAGTRTYGLRRVKDDEWVHSMLSTSPHMQILKTFPVKKQMTVLEWIRSKLLWWIRRRQTEIRYDMAELHMWDPDAFHIYLFCIVPPFNLPIMFDADLRAFLLCPIISLMLYTLVSCYEGLLRDKQLLFSQVLAEYNEKFVYKGDFNAKIRSIRVSSSPSSGGTVQYSSV